MEYRIIRHAEGSERKDHKYVARIPMGNGKGYRYFYTKAEWQAYLRDKKTVKDDGKNSLNSEPKKFTKEHTPEKKRISELPEEQRARARAAADKGREWIFEQLLSNPNRPRSREKNITGTGKKIKRRGQGIGGGPSRY